jgi:hypothetical protein
MAQISLLVMVAAHRRDHAVFSWKTAFFAWGLRRNSAGEAFLTI